MIVRQPGYAWIAVVLFVFMFLAILLGISLSSTDLLNGNTRTAASEATRAWVDVQAQDAAVSRLATQTRTVLDAENDRLMALATREAVRRQAEQEAQSAQAAPTMTAVAEQLEHEVQMARVAQASDNLARLYTLLAVVCVGAIGAGVGVLVYRLTLAGLVQLREQKGKQLLQEIDWNVAETRRLEKQIQSLRERRHYAEFVLASRAARQPRVGEEFDK